MEGEEIPSYSQKDDIPVIKYQALVLQFKVSKTSYCVRESTILRNGEFIVTLFSLDRQ